MQVHGSINTKRGDGEAAGKESVKHQKTQRVLDGRLNAANDVAREKNVEEESFNNESNAAKRKRSRRESESKKEGNEKVRDNEEEKRILGKNSRSAVNSAKNKNRASNPNVKGGASGNTRKDRENKKRKSMEEAEDAQMKEADNMRSNRGEIPTTSIHRD